MNPKGKPLVVWRRDEGNQRLHLVHQTMEPSVRFSGSLLPRLRGHSAATVRRARTGGEG